MARKYADVRASLDALEQDDESPGAAVIAAGRRALDTLERTAQPVPQMTWHADAVVFLWKIGDAKAFYTVTEDDRASFLMEVPGATPFRQDDMKTTSIMTMVLLNTFFELRGQSLAPHPLPTIRSPN